MLSFTLFQAPCLPSAPEREYRQGQSKLLLHSLHKLSQDPRLRKRHDSHDKIIGHPQRQFHLPEKRDQSHQRCADHVAPEGLLRRVFNRDSCVIQKRNGTKATRHESLREDGHRGHNESAQTLSSAQGKHFCQSHCPLVPSPPPGQCSAHFN